MATPLRPQRLDYSDLEVVPNPAPGVLAQSYGLEVYNDRNDPEVVWAENDPTTLPYAYAWPKEDKDASSRDPSSERQEAPLQTICGIHRKTFWIVAGVVGFILLGGAIGGGVGGYLASRSNQASSEPQSPYLNLSISALHWVDGDDVGHYRVYHQPAGQAHIFESAWSTDDRTWEVSPITDPDVKIKEDTPLASAAGYPHTNTSNGLVKSVYFLSPSGSLIERQSPYKTQHGVWGNDNLSGQYSPSATSPLFAYWYQDFKTRFQILTVFLQDFGADSLTVARYVEDVTDGEPWETARQSLDVREGSSVAAAPAGDRRDLRVYVGGTDGKLKQYPYNIEENGLGSATDTNFDFPPNTPICITTEDHRASFTNETLPECAKSPTGAFITHLVLFATPDRKSLTLVSWDCSSGFSSQQGRIEGLLRPGRTYLDLASASASNVTFVGDRVYVLFDGGEGPEIEEWEVPGRKRDGEGEFGGQWRLVGSVPTARTG